MTEHGPECAQCKFSFDHFIVNLCLCLDCPVVLLVLFVDIIIITLRKIILVSTEIAPKHLVMLIVLEHYNSLITEPS